LPALLLLLHQITVLISVAMLDMQAVVQPVRGFGQQAAQVKMPEIVSQLMVHLVDTVPQQAAEAALVIS
jgi:uncharacterized membrane protein SirB2